MLRVYGWLLDRVLLPGDFWFVHTTSQRSRPRYLMFVKRDMQGARYTETQSSAGNVLVLVFARCYARTWKAMHHRVDGASGWRRYFYGA